MAKIGIISDTHSTINPKVLDFLKVCNYIFHAGDIGNISVIEQLQEIAPVYAVHGNIDDHKTRLQFPEVLVGKIEDVKVAITHIGGQPNRYTQLAKKIIHQNRPKLFITGHSHICKVMFDQKYQMLYINPGAAGNHGFHRNITAIRLDVVGDRLSNLELFDLERK